jgi:hypothetical protein
MNPENTPIPKDRTTTSPLPSKDQNPDILPIASKLNINETIEVKKINIFICIPRSCSYAKYLNSPRKNKQKKLIKQRVRAILKDDSTI